MSARVNDSEDVMAPFGRSFRWFVVTTVSITAILSPITSVARPKLSEAELETKFKNDISANNIGQYIQQLTAFPSPPGSKFSPISAKMTEDMFRSWGWQTHVETYSILYPKPLIRLVELLGSSPFTASLKEPAIPGDAYSQQSEDTTSFLLYSPDGEVTAPAIYVNFGLRQDYEELARQGQSVKGKIVVARVGGLWRGGKVQLAAEHGAVGVLLYSDPHEDGFFRGDTYPKGGWRPNAGVQRGSVYYGKYPGDPLTPGRGASANAERLDVKSSKNTIAKIPALPLSAADVQPILASMEGNVVPESWRGSLPLTYHSGPTSAPVHMKLEQEWNRVDIHDVIATLPGGVYGTEEVIRGNHRDGWVFGAQDPHSGHSAMLEEARVLGGFYKSGWRPKRTIVYASWDAEEAGLVGSTEFVEEHLADIRKNAVAYLNTDMSGPGLVGASGSSELTGLAKSIAADVKDPGSSLSALDVSLVQEKAAIYEAPSSGPLGASRVGAQGPRRSRWEAIRPGGYGSDNHSFQSIAGIATFSIGFGGRENLGAYHSLYDNYEWYKRFGDPGFIYGVGTAQVNGLAVLRLADADLLPFDYRVTATAIDRDVAALKRIVTQTRLTAQASNDAVNLGAYKALNDPENPLTAPPIRAVPDVDFRVLDEAVSALHLSADAFGEAFSAAKSAKLPPAIVARVNLALRAVEQAQLRPEGLLHRPEYKNVLYSPARLWDTAPFPDVADAISDGQWQDVPGQLQIAAEVLRGMAKAIDNATAELERSRETWLSPNGTPPKS